MSQPFLIYMRVIIFYTYLIQKQPNNEKIDIYFFCTFYNR